MTTTLYLIRHAHAVWTPDEGRALSAQGRAGAEHVAALLGDRPLAAVYASTARRAIQTVTPLAAARGLAVTAMEDLRERRLSATPVDDHASAVAWCWAHPMEALPGGESNRAAQRRGVATIANLTARHSDAAIALGTHGNLLALILQHWQPAVDHTFWSSLTLPDIFILTLGDDGGAQVERLWDAGERFVPAVAAAKW
jgi:2,3-bisphosphoglycerate-dependent phosphoglycerate mutase